MSSAVIWRVSCASKVSTAWGLRTKDHRSTFCEYMIWIFKLLLSLWKELPYQNSKHRWKLKITVSGRANRFHHKSQFILVASTLCVWKTVTEDCLSRVEWSTLEMDICDTRFSYWWPSGFSKCRLSPLPKSAGKSVNDGRPFRPFSDNTWLW